MTTIVETDVNSIEQIVDSVHKAFRSGKTKPLEWRKQQLINLKTMLLKEKSSVVTALHNDLKQTEFLATFAELDGVVLDIELAIDNLVKWNQPKIKTLPMVHQPGSGAIHREPYGVVLLISPWNYPIRLCLMPLVGAIAAGNCVVIKPSEVAPSCSVCLANLIPKYLDTDCFKVVQGGIPQSTALLKQRFDYIFYTGNTQVGKIVMKAASENLTPVTLELGGKSPVVVDKEVDLDVCARRIIWGKGTNVGQTCVAADYVLVDRSVEVELLEKLKFYIKEFYGDNPQVSKDYTRIINERHTSRIAALIDEVKDCVYSGGVVDVSDRYVEPTLVRSPPTTSKLMTDEIFGPVLPVLCVDSIGEAIDFINAREKPLALYVFSSNPNTTKQVIDNTSSGSVCVNDIIVQIAVPTLPFGGVGHSGQGAYNGRYTFKEFSHAKTVVSKATWADPSIRYPPYTDRKVWWFQTLSKPPALSKPLTGAAVGVVAAAVWYYKDSLMKLFF